MEIQRLAGLRQLSQVINNQQISSGALTTVENKEQIKAQ